MEENIKEENIKFTVELKDGTVYSYDIAGVNNIIGAAFEIASSLMDGDLSYSANDILAIRDIPG